MISVSCSVGSKKEMKHLDICVKSMTANENNVPFAKQDNVSQSGESYLVFPSSKIDTYINLIYQYTYINLIDKILKVNSQKAYKIILLLEAIYLEMPSLRVFCTG